MALFQFQLSLMETLIHLLLLNKKRNYFRSIKIKNFCKGQEAKLCCYKAKQEANILEKYTPRHRNVPVESPLQSMSTA